MPGVVEELKSTTFPLSIYGYSFPLFSSPPTGYELLHNFPLLAYYKSNNILLSQLNLKLDYHDNL